MTFNLNGDLHKGDNFSVKLDHRGINYGDGVFETLKYANGRINFWEDHYFRLMSTMRILRMEIPMSFSPEFIENEIRKTLDAQTENMTAARVKLLVTRKAGGLYTPDSNDIDYLITASQLNNSSYKLNEKGLTVDLFKDFFVQKGMLSNLKLSATPVYTLASIFKKENGLDDCLLLNDQKHLCEATAANIFMVKDQRVITPSLKSGCLKGIIRKNVLELLKGMDYEVEEREDISPFELQKADELFMTNTTRGISWIENYRKKTFKKDLSEKLVKKLNIKVALA